APRRRRPQSDARLSLRTTALLAVDRRSGGGARLLLGRARPAGAYSGVALAPPACGRRVEPHAPARPARIARALAGLRPRMAARALALRPLPGSPLGARALQLLPVGRAHPAVRVRPAGPADAERDRRHGVRGGSPQQLRVAGGGAR